MVIALSGKKLAGKGTIADYLKSQHEAELFRFSQALTDIAKRLHKDNSRSNLVALGIGLRSAFGDAVLAETLMHDVQASNTPLRVIDGVRYVAEYEYIKNLPDFRMIYIDAPVETRHVRTGNRSEKTDEQGMSLEEFIKREDDATELGIERLKELSDIVVPNNATIEDFYAAFIAAVKLEG